MSLRASVRNVRVVMCALTVLALSGCSRTPPPPTPTVVTLVGEANLNAGGNAAVVRIYQLAGDANFQRASAQAFWQSDEQELGDELLGSPREVQLFPNVTESADLVLGDETQFVGFAADLRLPDPDHWRAIYPVDAVRGKTVAVRVGENRLFVTIP
ncbi:MAG: type VI secretion system lipoprotein TssJ [Bacteroidota bacterium]